MDLEKGFNKLSPSNSTGKRMLFLTDEDVKKVLTMEEAIEEVERRVPERVAPAPPIDWGWLRSVASRLESWAEAMTRHAENRSALSIYVLAKSANELLEEAKNRLLGVETIKRHEERKKPTAPRVLSEEEYRRLWEKFSEALRKEGINPELYRSRFDELIAWNMPYEDNEFIIMDEARKIILQKQLKKYVRKLPVKPVSFSWKYVGWALGSMAVDIGVLKDAIKEKNAIQAYGAITSLLETVDKLKKLLRLHPDVRGF